MNDEALMSDELLLICQMLQSSLSKQADDVEQLRAEIRGLEDQLKAAREKERLLVEYPDLHYVNNSSISIAGLTAKCSNESIVIFSSV